MTESLKYNSTKESLEPTSSPNEEIPKEAIKSWFARNKVFVWLYLGLAASSGCFAVTGSLYAFNAYAISVKKNFNLTQFEVQVVTSLTNFGVSLGLPAGLVQEKAGTAWTISLGICLTFTFFMLLWGAQYTLNFYVHNSWLLYIYFFMIGFGGCLGNMAVFPVMVQNFSMNKHGRVIAVIESFFSLGPAIFAAIYGAVFVQGHIYDEENQDLWGFFLFSALTFTTMLTLGFIFVRPMPQQDADLSESSHLIALKPDETEIHDSQEIVDLTGCALFCSTDFHLILWPFLMCTSIQLMFINNIPAYLTSFKHESYNTLLTIMSPVIAVVTKIIVGTLSDLTLDKLPRIFYLLICNVLQTVFLFLCIFFVNDIVLFSCTVIAVSMAIGAGWCLSPAMLSNMFGTKHFGVNWGSLLQGCAIGGFAAQAAFGVLYDAHLTAGNVCFGKHCFIWSFTMVVILSFISVILNAKRLCVQLKQ